MTRFKPLNEGKKVSVRPPVEYENLSIYYGEW